MIDRTYCTAADYARLTGYDRTTVLEWIKAGRIRSKKRAGPYSRHKIFQKYFKPNYINKIKKANSHYKKWWTDTELYVLRGHMDKKIGTLAALLPNRTKNAIKIKRTRIRGGRK